MVSGSHKPSSLPTLPHGPIWVTSLPPSAGEPSPLPRGSHLPQLEPVGGGQPIPLCLVWVPALSLQRFQLWVLRGRELGAEKRLGPMKRQTGFPSASTPLVECHSLITTPCAQGQQSFHFKSVLRPAGHHSLVSGSPEPAPCLPPGCALPPTRRSPPSGPAARGPGREGGSGQLPGSDAAAAPGSLPLC